MKNLLILLLSFLLSSSLYSQRASSSKIVCLNIIDNNQVEIKWTKSNVDSFDSYTLYYSNDGVNFSPISNSADVNDTTFLHTGINAFTSQRHYKIKVNGSTNDISPITSTLYVLGIDITTYPGYKADLYWTAFSDTMPSGMGKYMVFCDYPDGNWHLVDSTDQNFLRNITLHTCDDSISFKVEISYSGECISNSQVVKGEFIDNVNPDKPVLDSVSVTPDGQTIIGWTQSDSMDVAGNIIYRYEGGIWVEIDSVWGYNTQIYIDTNINPCIENYEYAIASFDSCGNKSPFTDLTAQRPIFLYDIPYSICDLEDTLRWIIYEHPKNPIDHYEIWSSKNGAPFEIVGQKNPSDANNGEIIFIHKDLDPGAVYEYYIRAVMGDISTSSCRKTLTTASYKIPQFVNTVTADVLEDNTVNLTIDGDMEVNNCIWDIWRYKEGQPDTTAVAQVTKPGQNITPFNVPDNNVDASLNPWFYYTTVIDSCGKLRLSSNTFKTIWLQGYTLDNINHLEWTATEGWADGVERYYIYRTVVGIEPTSPIDSVDGNTLQYQDPAPTQGVEDGRTIYFVKALENSDTGELVYSTSNRIQLFKEATLYFANAFKPGGIDNTFKPVFSYFGGTAYLFQIYNRWGKLIFETSDPNEGWDGTYQNNPTEKGVYIYVVSWHTVNGKNKTEKGSFLLLR